MQSTDNSHSRRYLIVARCDDSIHLYHLCGPATRKSAMSRFSVLAEREGWQGIRDVNAIRLSENEELTSLATLPLGILSIHQR